MRRMLHEGHTLRTSPEKAGARRLLWSESRGGGDRLIVAESWHRLIAPGARVIEKRCYVLATALVASDISAHATR